MSESASRTAPASVRRRQVLDAAKRRFRRVGFHSTRISEIAKEAGVSVGMIYHHFDNKEAIIEAIIREDLELQLEQLSTILVVQEGSMKDVVERGLDQLRELLADADRTALMLEVAAEAVRNLKIRAFFAQTQLDIEKTLGERLAAISKQSGIPQKELKARVQTISALSQGLATQMAVQDAPLDETTFDVFKRTIRRVLEG